MKLKRKTYIVKPSLQIKYLITTLAMVFITGVIVYFNLWYGIKSDPKLWHLTAETWQLIEAAYRFNFIIIVIGLLVAFGLTNLFLFHRIAGPLFSIERTIKKLSDGELSANIQIRRKDEIQDFAGEIQSMIENLRKIVSDDKEKIKQIQEALEKGNIDEAKNKLATVNERLKLD